MKWFFLPLFACSDAPPPLSADLAGSWDVVFGVDGTSDRSGIAELGWLDEDQVLEGEITMFDPDRERVYAIVQALDIDILGTAVEGVETTGTRQLFFELMPVADDATDGAWRTRWGCSEPPDNLCGESGSIALVR